MISYCLNMRRKYWQPLLAVILSQLRRNMLHKQWYNSRYSDGLSSSSCLRYTPKSNASCKTKQILALPILMFGLWEDRHHYRWTRNQNITIQSFLTGNCYKDSELVQKYCSPYSIWWTYTLTKKTIHLHYAIPIYILQDKP